MPASDVERQGLAPMPMKVSLDEADWQMSTCYFELLLALLSDGYTPAASTSPKPPPLAVTSRNIQT